MISVEAAKANASKLEEAARSLGSASECLIGASSNLQEGASKKSIQKIAKQEEVLADNLSRIEKKLLAKADEIVSVAVKIRKEEEATLKHAREEAAKYGIDF